MGQRYSDSSSGIPDFEELSSQNIAQFMGRYFGIQIPAKLRDVVMGDREVMTIVRMGYQQAQEEGRVRDPGELTEKLRAVIGGLSEAQRGDFGRGYNNRF